MHIKRVLGGLAFSILLVASFANNVFAEDVLGNEPEDILMEYCEFINGSDVDGYISLFTEDHQVTMKDFVEENSDETFFQESNVSIQDFIELSDEELKISLEMIPVELSKYDECKAYYVHLSGDFEYADKDDTFKVFLIVQENDEWSISNIYTPVIYNLYKEGVSFGSEEETMEMNSQMQASLLGEDDIAALDEETLLSDETLVTNEDGVLRASTLKYTAPSTITVYFNKSANSSYYGKKVATLDFHEYLKNVVPEEWVVSYYGSYPAYLQAGVMASKMYGWYHTVYPSYQYSPYYADVMDDSNSQNYLYNSYSSMSSTYQGYLNSAMSYAKNLVMVTETSEKLFLVQYRASSGSAHSGIINQAAALTLAKQGYAAVEILNNFLGSSTYTNGEAIKFMTCYES